MRLGRGSSRVLPPHAFIVCQLSPPGAWPSAGCGHGTEGRIFSRGSGGGGAQGVLGSQERKVGRPLGAGKSERARDSRGGRQGGGGEGDCLHEFPSGRPASALCPMRSVRGGTRLTFPHHFTVTFGRQAGSHAGALSPELVDLFGISLPLRISAVAGLCTDGPAHPPASCTSGCGQPEPSAPGPRLHTEPSSSERHERNSEAPAQRAGTSRCSRLSGADPERLQPFVNQEA